MNPSSQTTLTIPVLTISRGDRWQACQRLQDLDIACHCTTDGYLQVEISTPATILQLRSVIQQITAPRTELVDWLGRCWHCNPFSGNL